MILAALALASQPAPPPLVRTNTAPPVIITPSVSLPKWTYGDWATVKGTAYAVASTSNISGSEFGMICTETCSWYINFNLSCTEGDKYPAMVSATSFVLPLTLKCVHIEKLNVLVFSVDSVSLNAIANDGEIGFVAGRVGGRFTVSRFSLKGAPEAAAKAMTLAVEFGNKSQSRQKDYSL